MLTNPAAGVMATSPAMMPEAMPSEVAFFRWTDSINTHISAAAAAASAYIRTRTEVDVEEGEVAYV